MGQITLEKLVVDFADGLQLADAKSPACTTRKASYKPGIGPFPEAVAITLAFQELQSNGHSLYDNASPRTYAGSRTKCDLVIPSEWAVEFKLIRPFGDNGKPAENWIENVLYPYPGNVSALGDCLKLANSDFRECKAVIVFGYEHIPAEIELETAVKCFEQLARNVLEIALGPRAQTERGPLKHPFHQRVRVYGWEVRTAIPVGPSSEQT